MNECVKFFGVSIIFIRFGNFDKGGRGRGVCRSSSLWLARRRGSRSRRIKMMRRMRSGWTRMVRRRRRSGVGRGNSGSRMIRIDQNNDRGTRNTRAYKRSKGHGR